MGAGPFVVVGRGDGVVHGVRSRGKHHGVAAAQGLRGGLVHIQPHGQLVGRIAVSGEGQHHVTALVNGLRLSFKRDLGLVVGDDAPGGQRGLPVLKGRVDGIAQHHREVLGELGEPVIDHRHLDHRAPCAGSEGERPRGFDDVVAGAGNAVGDLVVDGDGPERRQRADHVHPEFRRAVGFAYLDGDVPESEHGQRVSVAHCDRRRSLGGIDDVAVAGLQRDHEERVRLIAVVGLGEVRPRDPGISRQDRVRSWAQQAVRDRAADLGVRDGHRQRRLGVAVVHDPVVEQGAFVHHPGDGPHANRVGIVVQNRAPNRGRARWRPKLRPPGVQRELVVPVRGLVVVVVVEGQVQQGFAGSHPERHVLLCADRSARDGELDRVLVLADPLHYQDQRVALDHLRVVEDDLHLRRHVVVRHVHRHRVGARDLVLARRLHREGQRAVGNVPPVVRRRQDDLLHGFTRGEDHVGRRGHGFAGEVAVEEPAGVVDRHAHDRLDRRVVGPGQREGDRLALGDAGGVGAEADGREVVVLDAHLRYRGAAVLTVDSPGSPELESVPGFVVHVVPGGDGERLRLGLGRHEWEEAVRQRNRRECHLVDPVGGIGSIGSLLIGFPRVHPHGERLYEVPVNALDGECDRLALGHRLRRNRGEADLHEWRLAGAINCVRSASVHGPVLGLFGVGQGSSVGGLDAYDFRRILPIARVVNPVVENFDPTDDAPLVAGESQGEFLVAVAG